MRARLCLARCLSLVGLLGLSALAHATPKPAPSAQITPQAKTLCGQVTAAYRALTSYSDWISINALENTAGPRLNLAFRRPNEIGASNLSADHSREIASDGATLLIISDSPHKEVKRRPALQGKDFLKRTLALIGVTNIGIVPDLLEGSDCLTLLKQQRLTSLTLGSTSVLNRTLVIQLIATTGSNAGGATRAIYEIGKSDHLLRRVLTTSLMHGARQTRDETHNVYPNPNYSASAFLIPPPPVIDQRALTILHQMAHAYLTLKSYSDTETLKAIVPPSMPDAQYWSDANLEVAFQRPNLAHVIVHNQRGDTDLVSDGQFSFLPMTDAIGHYGKVPAPKDQQAIRQVMINAKSNLEFLISGQELLNSGPMLTESLALGAPANMDGVTVDTIVAEEGNPGRATDKLTFAIGHDDHLLRRMHIVMTTSKGQQPMEITQTYTHVTANPTLPSNTWVFHLPIGARIVKFTTTAYNPRLKIGVRPFAIQATDLNGNIISLAQYKGKVVQLHFWQIMGNPATQEELKTLALYHKYHRQGFEVIGIFLSSAPPQGGTTVVGTDNYPILYDFLQQHPLRWRQIFDGYGWEGNLAQLYGVGSQSPVNMLIGRDGRIVALRPRLETVDPSQSGSSGDYEYLSAAAWENAIRQALKPAGTGPH